MMGFPSTLTSRKPGACQHASPQSSHSQRAASPQALPGPVAICLALTEPHTPLFPIAETRASATRTVTGNGPHGLGTAIGHSVPPSCPTRPRCHPGSPLSRQRPSQSMRPPRRRACCRSREVLRPRRDHPPPTCQNQGPAMPSGSSGRPSGDICRAGEGHTQTGPQHRTEQNGHGSEGRTHPQPVTKHSPGGRGAGPLLPGPRRGQRRKTLPAQE